MKINEKINRYTLFLIGLLLSSAVFAAIPSRPQLSTVDAKSDLEKLTGVSSAKISSKPTTRPAKALAFARQSRDQKKYILAIKRYNYIIKNYAGTKEYAMALFDKSAMYKKMGFEKPSSYNLNKAKLASVVVKKTNSIKK
jgi:hypothetical protein